jgi:hypothetical protein
MACISAYLESTPRCSSIQCCGSGFIESGSGSSILSESSRGCGSGSGSKVLKTKIYKYSAEKSYIFLIKNCNFRTSRPPKRHKDKRHQDIKYLFPVKLAIHPYLIRYYEENEDPSFLSPCKTLGLMILSSFVVHSFDMIQKLFTFKSFLIKVVKVNGFFIP